jgi:hypothetical protein
MFYSVGGGGGLPLPLPRDANSSAKIAANTSAHISLICALTFSHAPILY